MKVVLRLLMLCLVMLPTSVTKGQKPEGDPIKRAIAELQAGHTQEAIAALTEAISQHPNHADAYLLRSSLRVSSGDTYGAMGDINKVIQLKPDLGAAYHERAMIRLLANDTQGALHDLDLAIMHGYNGDHVYTLRGQLKLDQKDLKGALSDFDEAIKLNPDNPQTYASRAGLLLSMGDPDRALLDLNYLLTWYETDPTKRQAAASETKTSVADEGATKNDAPPFSVGIEIKTSNAAPGDREMLPVIAAAYVNRGLINSARSNSDAAISDFTKSIRINPNDISSFYHRANELEIKGDLAAALADVSRAIQLDPMNGNLRVEHGVILSLMGKHQDAKLDFDMLLNADRAMWQTRIDERMDTVRKRLPEPPTDEQP